MDNFFASQINNDLGQLINTTGTFCGSNSVPPNVGFGTRQGYDITNVDASSTIIPNQTTAYALGTTAGDDYMINALGIQISVSAPIIFPIKLINGKTSIDAQIGDIVDFSITIDNTGSVEGDNVMLTDPLETGLILVPNTFTVNGVPVANPDLVNGVPLGTIPTNTTVTVNFKAMILSSPPGNMFVNQTNATFNYFACNPITPFSGMNISNVVTIFLPDPIPIAPPPDFTGVIKKCEFINKTTYLLKAAWTPSASPNVVSYLILEDGKIVATIPATGPYVFETCLHSKKEAPAFSIVSLFPNSIESAPLNIRITNE